MNSRATFRGICATVAAVCLCPAILPAQTTQTLTYSYNGQPLPIFRDDANIVTLAYISVPRSIRIQDVNATLDIDYPRVGDLNVFLYSPEGTRTILLERNCSSASLRRTTFDDSAANRYSDVCPISAGGSFRGNEPLANSNGQSAAGVWTLAV
jgi:subtilisin-like proprotein convertase family protein